MLAMTFSSVPSAPDPNRLFMDPEVGSQQRCAEGTFTTISFFSLIMSHSFVTALEFSEIIRLIYYVIYIFKHISFCLGNSFHLFLRRLHLVCPEPL